MNNKGLFSHFPYLLTNEVVGVSGHILIILTILSYPILFPCFPLFLKRICHFYLNRCCILLEGKLLRLGSTLAKTNKQTSLFGFLHLSSNNFKQCKVRS